MKIASSLKSLKKRDLDSKLVKRRGKLYVINKKSYSIIKVARLFTNKIKFLPKRNGERYASALTDMNLSNKVYKLFGKKDLISYINNFKKNIS